MDDSRLREVVDVGMEIVDVVEERVKSNTMWGGGGYSCGNRNGDSKNDHHGLDVVY